MKKWGVEDKLIVELNWDQSAKINNIEIIFGKSKLLLDMHLQLLGRIHAFQNGCEGYVMGLDFQEVVAWARYTFHRVLI